MDPPIPEPWRELDHCARMEIRELAPEGSIALVRALLRGEPPAELTALIEKDPGQPVLRRGGRARPGRVLARWSAPATAGG